MVSRPYSIFRRDLIRSPGSCPTGLGLLRKTTDCRLPSRTHLVIPPKTARRSTRQPMPALARQYTAR